VRFASDGSFYRLLPEAVAAADGVEEIRQLFASSRTVGQASKHPQGRLLPSRLEAVGESELWVGLGRAVDVVVCALVPAIASLGGRRDRCGQGLPLLLLAGAALRCF
jgi:hypothetical protein